MSSSLNSWPPPPSSSQRCNPTSPNPHTTQAHFLSSPDHHPQTCLCLALFLRSPFWCCLLFFFSTLFSETPHFQYFSIHPRPNSSIETSLLVPALGDSVKSKTQGAGMDVQLVLEHTAWVCAHSTLSPCQASLHSLTSLEKTRPWRWMLP